MIYAFQNLFDERSMKNVDGLAKIIDEFDSILEAMSKIKDGKVEEDLQSNSSLTASSSRFVHKVVGLDDKLMQIKDQLTGTSSQLETISIHGMGGIGKTTLARNLNEDSLIEYHCDIRAWIVVSQQYHDREMLTSLLDSIGYVIDDNEKKSNAQLAEYVYKSLKGMRYLIVMDDVWDTKVCDDVKRFLPDDNNGSLSF
ncbi:hypothetical protein BUALT_Bualt02G0135200 [Buddleja alternifolia]|uniref:NB-ARC domain-containing protein n=1 Tax=Buddleja alternifolia TaxID=168488 RepID=A0AAV6Y6P1_9LAMI|nr:hypothetical protein BUALT_Bualt02G0135200 [Buddleja alternifolia]